MYDLIVRKRKLNKFRVALVVLVVLSIILSIFAFIKINKNKNVNKSVEDYSNWVENINAENELKEKEKFKTLNEEEIKNVDSIYKHQENKRVFLTFDDGPTKAVTPYILDLLKQENIKATFFVLGTRVEESPELIKREYEDGHYIANHGYTHKYDDIYSSEDAVLEEYNATNNAIKNALENQNYNSLIFRFPGGSSGGKYHDLKQNAKQTLKDNGIATLDWNALTNDAAGANTKEKIMQNFYDTVQDKTSIVLLMHDASDKILTYECLPEMIQYFRENGYSFKNMYDILERQN